MYIGAAIDSAGWMPNPKMQILDLRYYAGSCLTDNEIENIIDPTATCHPACNSSCWGPGNYSCNTFLTIVDPIEGYSLSGDYNVFEESKKSWEASDTFFQDTTFNSRNVAWTAWMYQRSTPTSLVSLVRATNED